MRIAETSLYALYAKEKGSTPDEQWQADAAHPSGAPYRFAIWMNETAERYAETLGKNVTEVSVEEMEKWLTANS